MGWTSGGEFADKLWHCINKYIPEDKKYNVANNIIDLFEDRDCDVMQETKLWPIVYKQCENCEGEGINGLLICHVCDGIGQVKRK